jgi:hypothetical protein
MAYGPAIMKIEYEHPNFNGEKSSIELQANPIFPGLVVSLPGGEGASTVQLMPGDNGAWTAQANLANRALAMIVFAAGGYRVDLSEGQITVYDSASTVMFQVP